MNTDRDKYLTEAMGGKVRTVTAEKRKFRGGGYMFMDFVCSCCNGPQSACDNYATDFSTWDGFGKLLAFIKLQEWFEEFLNIMDVGEHIPCSDGEFTFDMQGEFINPDILATAYHEFLKGREA